jgi:hypothetical protein
LFPIFILKIFGAATLRLRLTFCAGVPLQILSAAADAGFPLHPGLAQQKQVLFTFYFLRGFRSKSEQGYFD